MQRARGVPSLPGPSGLGENVGLLRRLLDEPIPVLDECAARFGRSFSLRAAMDAAWVPFGRGPRRCIGFALAQMELTLVLARWAQRLDLSLVRPETPAPYGMVVNRPRCGIWVTGGPAAPVASVDP